MYDKKRNKICPFCRGKIDKEFDRLICCNCGFEFDRQTVDTKTRNSNFFNDQR